jgi:hypothetical protein
VFNSVSSMISSILSSAIGIFSAVAYFLLFRRSTARALKSVGPFSPVRMLSGLFLRLALIGFVLFAVSRVRVVNLLVVLMNFVIMVPILLVWLARNFSRQPIHLE